MMSYRIVGLLLLAACSSKKAAPETTGSGSALPAGSATTTAGSATTTTAGSAATTGSAGSGTAAAPPATSIYAGLFTKGTTWTFTAEVKTTPPVDMGKPTTEKQPNTTCTVTDVHDMKGATMAKVDCKPALPANHPPGGWYVSTKDGLWRFDADDAKAHDKATAPDPKTMMIGASPAVRTVEGKGPDEGESWVYETKQEGDAWCGYYSHALGDEGGWGFCFDPKGMVKANYFQAGATTVETFYKRQ